MDLYAVRPILGRWLTFTYVQNRGAAFGLLGGQTFMLAMISIGLLVGLFVFRSKLHDLPRGGKLAISLIVAGALGNLYDRLAFGYVIDFIDLQVWPVFNIADSAIVVGAFLMVWVVWRMEMSGEQK